MEAAALSRDGERIAATCGADVCVRRWGAEAIESRLAAGARRGEIGALAFRLDRGLLVAAHRQRMKILTWDLPGAAPREWAVAVDDRPSRSIRRAALLLGERAGYLATAGPDAVVLHAWPSGAVAASVPVSEPVWRMAMSGDGRVLAVATQHRVALWRLAQEP